MTISVGVSGVNKAVSTLSVGISGVWKKVSKVWVGVGGAWKQAFTSVSVSIQALSASGTGYANIAFLSSGSGSTQSGVFGTPIPFTWLNEGSSSDVEIYVTGTGDTPATSSINTWLNLGTNRVWTLSTGGNAKTFTGTYELRDANSLESLGSSTFYLRAH